MTFGGTGALFYSPFVVEQGRPIISTLGPWWLGPWPAPYDAVPSIDPDNVVAAYQPKAATGTIYERTVTNYAESLVNIASPGTHDAISVVGFEPAWDSAIGWTKDSGKYLITDIIAGDAGQDHALFGAFSNINFASQNVICGTQDLTVTPRWQTQIYANNVGTSRWANCQNAVTFDSVPIVGGVMGFTNRNAYLDGAIVSILGPFEAASTCPQYLMVVNNSGTPVIDIFATGNFHAFVFYKPAITDAQAAAVSWAMNVIRSA